MVLKVIVHKNIYRLSLTKTPEILCSSLLFHVARQTVFARFTGSVTMTTDSSKNTCA